ncbi:hypothetical protein AS589_03775 [Empedobacter brevis]|uniref:hypothetical protein n=1 Tax=Empedobacter brevis TaxID=247 RepID=UPI0013203C70|nr:hypothetical protein [Empedobacter brevis]QHC83976.1 hypothetical protein AS589_03775 [Empedobacter brevis]
MTKSIPTIILYCFLLLVIQSCLNSNDTFIKKHDNLNLDEFKGLYLHYLYKNNNQISYFTSYGSENYPPYIITFDKKQKKIVNIDRKLLKKLNRADYFSEKEFKRVDKLINVLIENDIPYILVKVDSSLNTFYNPKNTNEPLLLMKLNNKEEKLDTIKKSGFSFKHYKGNWYIRY